MSDFKISSGSKILCRELNTGKEYNGFFYFDEKTIKAEICSFDNSFYIKEEKPIFLHSENNHVISLHDNISSPAGSCSRHIEPKMVTHKQHIISNIAVVGHDKWEKGDLIKRVTFSVRHSDDFFKHKETYDKYLEGWKSDKKKGVKKFLNFLPFKKQEEDLPDVFLLSVNGLNIRVRYHAMYTAGFNEPREIWPRIEIELDEAVNLYEYLEPVECVVRFLSLSLGVPLTPSDFKICKLSFEGMVKAVEASSYPGDYAVQYVWPENDFRESDLWVGGSLVRAYDDDELEALKNCLTAWVSRYADWRKASIQMMRSLALNGEISADRLLAACKWFEEIPLTKSENAITDEHIQEIADIAAEKASSLGYGNDIGKRISGSLKSIKTETHENRFTRLINLIDEKLSLNFSKEEFVAHLMKAQSFRGKVAHGHFSPADEEEFRAFSKSIYAMEALCFLLTSYELPINDEGKERIRNNPFMKNYRLS